MNYNLILIFSIVVILFIPISIFAHQDWCHSNHSCPSDSGTYTCGDTGNCSECPDNQYCKSGNYGSAEIPKKSYEGRESCTQGLVCLKQGDFLKYEYFLESDLYYKQTYTYEGIMDEGIIAVHATGIPIYKGKEEPSQTSLIEMNLCCGIVVDGQYNILQPSPVNIDRWLKSETSSEHWKNKVSESTYDYNGKLRQVILVKIGNTEESTSKEYIDKETGILLYRTSIGYGNIVETINLVDTNIIFSSNSKNFESQFPKTNNELIFSKSFSTSSSNNFKEEQSSLSLMLPSNWMIPSGSDAIPPWDQKFLNNNWAISFFNKDSTKPVRIEIQYDSDLMRSPYTSFETLTNTEILEKYRNKIIQVPSSGSEITIKHQTVERFPDGIKINITYDEDSKDQDDREAYLYNHTLFILKNGKQFFLLLGGYESNYNQNIADFESMVTSFYADSGFSYSKTSTTTQQDNSIESKIPTKIGSKKYPDEIKTSARKWALGIIDNQEFSKELEFLINQGILKVPSAKQTDSYSNIPIWIKHNAKWWSEGQIDNITFVNGIQFLITKEIIRNSDGVIPSPSCLGKLLCIKEEIIEIIDGDTIYTTNNKIRISLTNTPEKDQTGFSEATEFTTRLCPVGSTITIDQDDLQPYDKYNRLVGKVFCGEKLLNSELLYNHHANILTEYCKTSEFSSEPWAKEFGC